MKHLILSTLILCMSFSKAFCQVDSLPMPVLKIIFTFDKLNHIQSDQNEKLQKSFLDSIGLPTSNINYQAHKEKFDYQRIDSSYESVASSLKEKLYKDIYKQVASQILILYFLESSHNDEEITIKIYKYLDEMTKNNGVNPGIYAYGLIKIESMGSDIDICNIYKTHINISNDYLKRRKNHIEEVEHNFTNPKDDKVIKILLGVMNRDLNRDIIFTNHLKRRFEIICK